MAYGTLQTDVINASTGVFSTNNAYSGIAKAWVRFAGSTATIAGSFNVSSITRTSTGYYTVNFTTAMTDINYTANVNVSGNGSVFAGSCGVFNDTGGNSVAPTTSLFKFTTAANGGSTTSITVMDSPYVNVIVFGA